MQVIVSLHDVAPATADESRRWLSLAETHGVRTTLLVVPGPWRGHQLRTDTPFVDWLHDAGRAGHELALHGWIHQGGPGRGRSAIGRPVAAARGQLLARGCAEFLQLDEHEARERLELGLATLRSVGVEPVGFTPPGWLASPGTLRALRELGFRYTTTQRAVHDLTRRVQHSIFAVSQRPGSRWTTVAARANERIVAELAERGRSIRIALHPDDLHHPDLADSVDRMLRRAIAAGARPSTYTELVA